MRPARRDVLHFVEFYINVLATPPSIDHLVREIHYKIICGTKYFCIAPDSRKRLISTYKKMNQQHELLLLLIAYNFFFLMKEQWFKNQSLLFIAQVFFFVCGRITLCTWSECMLFSNVPSSFKAWFKSICRQWAGERVFHLKSWANCLNRLKNSWIEKFILLFVKDYCRVLVY